jgi:hypothetical protein
MAVNNPPIKNNPVEATWDFEVTVNINNMEERLLSLLRAIQEATDLDELKELSKNI